MTPSAATPASPRRERVRRATIEEIKETARRQLAIEGAATLSLRGVAREMGLTASALYRYFPSRDDLLTDLVVDAFTSLADRLEVALDAAWEGSGGQLWVDVARAYRAWAIEHPSDYTLIFSTPVPGYEAPEDRTKPAMFRGVGVLLQVMTRCVAAGEMDPDRLEELLSPALRPQLEAWSASGEAPLPPGALSAALTCWATLHGLITLELFHHLPPMLDGGALFDQQMVVVLDRIGYIGPRPT
ncbi:MAG: TetR/AcrR family transcriptional regulator [Frankiaceae bacterium]